MWKRIWTIFISRNKEFYRDKSTFFWNLLFPFLIILGFGIMFNEDKQVLYKVGVINTQDKDFTSNEQFQYFNKIKYLEFIEFSSRENGLDKLKHHRVDIIIKPDSKQYWISSTSPKGYVLEKILHSYHRDKDNNYEKQSISGINIPYIDWLFPGILGMNMMFSSLFGVGYVIVRYRKNGVLKRFSVTPIKTFEFLTAQVLSRMFVILSTTTIVYVGCYLVYGFECRGSYLSLLLVFALGGFSMISLGLLIAARSSSEEFAGGVLNLITWPMMFFSEVWFSLEGADPYIQKASKIFPLTHIIDSARKIMNDGATLYDIRYQVIILVIMSVVFIVSGSFFFKWQKA